MDLELFERIVEKISLDSPGTTVALFNWTDPLVHPSVESFVKIINKHGLSSFISTNLNLVRDFESLIEANPDRIRISLSGFTQDVYSIGHKAGNVEIVKENMRKISNIIEERKSNTKIEVYYHKYKYNLHEIEKMKEFSGSLGFYFFSDWAVYMPIERLVSFMEGAEDLEDREFVETKYALNVRKAMDETAPYRQEPCHLKGSPITIDCRGNVVLCCL